LEKLAKIWSLNGSDKNLFQFLDIGVITDNFNLSRKTPRERETCYKYMLKGKL